MSPLQRNGFSLVEILVSVFVLAVGVIGAAAMQLSALRTSQQSAFQTAALSFASELADKMRSHPQQMQLPDRANPFLNIDFESTHDRSEGEVGGSCFATDCKVDELVQFDIEEWSQRVRTALPGVRVKICRDEQPWDSRLGAYRWQCSVAGGDWKRASLVIKIGWLGKGFAPDGKRNVGDAKDFPPSLALTVAPYIQ